MNGWDQLIPESNPYRLILLEYLHKPSFSFETLSPSTCQNVINEIIKLNLPAKSSLQSVMTKYFASVKTQPSTPPPVTPAPVPPAPAPVTPPAPTLILNKSSASTANVVSYTNTIKCNGKYISEAFRTYLKKVGRLKQFFDTTSSINIHIDEENKCKYIIMDWKYNDFISDYILTRTPHLNLLDNTDCNFTSLEAELNLFGFVFPSSIGPKVKQYCNAKVKARGTSIPPIPPSPPTAPSPPKALQVINTNMPSANNLSIEYNLTSIFVSSVSSVLIPSQTYKNITTLYSSQYDECFKQWLNPNVKLQLVFKYRLYLFHSIHLEQQ